ncbi:tRNA-(guanine-N1)-methyltransferase [Buttiauxella sp. B2]|uniref:toxin YdaT family protein n=1 Tax=Buttiauxella sp. B2 TaxID=2587812 RepID=UPI00111FCC20|nr:toxin YdaT family protein [Buttiauxella sp. B2]TNV22852.1 tRNA-(guanine-N1)-methyltransferase [Buttiauxella sp. B2]
MQIKHELVRDVIRTWAVGINRENVGRAVATEYFLLGGGDLRLLPVNEPGAGHVNQQNLFRWLDSDTDKAKAKVRQLLPAILNALPRQLSARLVLANSMEFRAIQMARTALDDAADAYVAATVVDVVNHYSSGYVANGAAEILH